MAGKSSKSQKATASLYPLLAVNFVGTLSLGIILPFLIYLVTDFGGNSLVYGILGATYSAFQLIGAPLLGKWSDLYGRRKILLLSQIGTLVSWLIFLLALFLPVITLTEVNSRLFGNFSLSLPLIILFFARVVDGLTGGNVSVANAYLADITKEANRSANFGKMAISSNLGYIIGPAMAGLLGATVLGEKLPVLAALLVSVIATLIIIYMLPESIAQSMERDPEKLNVRKILGPDQKECFQIECKDKISLRDVLKMKRVVFLLLIYFFVFLGFNFFYVAFPVHAIQTLHWNMALTGLFFSFMGAVMILVQGPLLGFLTKKWRDQVLICTGSFILALSFLFYNSTESWLMYAGALLLALGNGLMWPSLLSLISKSILDRFQGTIQGYAGSLGSAASIIGLLTGGLLYTLMGAGIFVLSALVIFVIFLLSFLLFKDQNLLVQEKTV